MPSSYTIGEHYEGFVRTLLASGRYASASEVMRDALRLLEEQEQLRQLRVDALRAEVQRGLDGLAAEWNLDKFLAEAHRRLDGSDADAA